MRHTVILLPLIKHQQTQETVFSLTDLANECYFVVLVTLLVGTNKKTMLFLCQCMCICFCVHKNYNVMKCKCFVSDLKMKKTVKRTSTRYVSASKGTSHKIQFIFFFCLLKVLKYISTFILQSLVSSSLDTSSAFWLKTHGLVARRLTIMDALAPTAVPHGTKYIPVLDKHVVSKVFDEVKRLCCFKVNINLCTVSKRIFFTHFHKFHNYIVQCSWQMADVH